MCTFLDGPEPVRAGGLSICSTEPKINLKESKSLGENKT
jgi:hypothetical protein